MSTTARGRRGHTKLSDGIDDELRLGGYRQLVVNDLGIGRFTEMVAAGQVWTTLVKAVTIAATHNSPISANTATPVIGLLNTDPSTVGVLLAAVLTTVSGTPAGGQAVINYQPGPGPASQITAAATGSIFNCDGRAGASPQGSIMKPLNNVALGGWLATPNAVQENQMIGGAAAAAAAGNPQPGKEYLDGLQLMQPGSLTALMAGSGAGTSWIVNAQLWWIEMDPTFLKAKF